MNQSFKEVTTKIKELPKDLVRRIAAGEIITSFAAVVRELVENAIDGNADTISVTFDLGDPSNLVVEDNGEGIGISELNLVTKRFATSKINCFDDIFTSSSCGFRGEALAAISMVSDFSLMTSESSDGLGIQAWYEEGRLAKQQEVARERGTTVYVSRLFYNVPVRKKFLKNAKSEKLVIKKDITMYALAHPKISFQYYVVSNGKKTLELSIPKFFGLRERILRLFPKQNLSKGLLRIEIPSGYTKLPFYFSGYATNYRFYFPSNKNQYLFYRGRSIENPAFFRAVREAYKHFLPKQYHSMVFLQLYMNDPFLADVNVHPSKKEVDFKTGMPFYREIYKILNDALREHMRFSSSLMRQESAFDGQRPLHPYENKEESEKHEECEKQDENKECQDKDLEVEKVLGPREKMLLQKLKDAQDSGNFTHIKKDELDKIEELVAANLDVNTDFSDIQPSFLMENSKKITENVDENKDSPKKKDNGLPVCVFGQVAFLYIVFSIGKDLYLMDQHAAHERINYDFLLQKQLQHSHEREVLLVPLIFDFLPIDCENLLQKESQEMFQRLGLVVARYGENQIAVEEVPAFLSDNQREKTVRDALEFCLKNTEKTSVDFFREIIARWACRMSVMAGDVMTHEEMKALVDAIITKNYQISCPHGRPFVKKISLDELNSFFFRSRHIVE